jgi:hypothetical protein
LRDVSAQQANRIAVNARAKRHEIAVAAQFMSLKPRLVFRVVAVVAA